MVNSSKICQNSWEMDGSAQQNLSSNKATIATITIIPIYVSGAVLNPLHMLTYLTLARLYVLHVNIILILEMREMRSSELGGVRAGIQTHGVLLQPECLYFKLWFSSVESLCRAQPFVTPWTAAGQASLSITNSWCLFKLTSIELVMPCNHLILCHPLLPPPLIFPSIRVFSNESVLPIRWPKYWSFSFNISPANDYSGLISFRMDWLDLLACWISLSYDAAP